MFFRKSEGKRWNPCVIITIGALTCAGAVSVAQKSKKWVSDKWNKMKGLMKSDESMQ